MHAKAVEKLFLRGGKDNKTFYESPALTSNPHRAAMIDHFDRKSIEEFVAENE
jgi:hypothetical protein